MMARRSEGLSQRHIKIMEFLTDFQDRHGYSPAIRQIGDNIGVESTSLIDYYLTQLTTMGYIQREKHISRSIRVIKPMYPTSAERPVKASRLASLADMLSIPIMGRIVAGEPIPVPASSSALFDAESSVEVARSLLPSREKVGELFALEVQGDSMVDAMVNDGDIIILRPAKTANNGDMVAVWLEENETTTLKYFYSEADRIRLQPANPSYEPIYIYNTDQVHVQGKVLMVIRQFTGIH
jgi:repressor LexA